MGDKQVKLGSQNFAAAPPAGASAHKEQSHEHPQDHSHEHSAEHPKEHPKAKVEKINAHDFIEIEYTGRVKDDDSVFDTTDEKTAKDAGIRNPRMEYGPLVICVGEGNVLHGLEAALEGKETGKKYSIPLSPELGFGKKSAKLVELIPTMKFIREKIQPMPGLQVDIDNRIGIVRHVSGGRTLVDFNHPLSGKDLVYDVKVFGKVTDPRKKIGSILRMQLNMKDFFVEVKGSKAVIGMKKMQLPEQILEPLRKMITDLVPEVKEAEFVDESKEKSKAGQGKEKSRVEQGKEKSRVEQGKEKSEEESREAIKE